MTPVLNEWWGLLVSLMILERRKTREKNKKLIFIALKSLTALFVSASKIFGHHFRLFGLAERGALSKVGVRLFRVTCYGLLLVSVLSYTLRVESSITRAPKVDTIHLFPGVVESEAWVHDADLLVRDVTEDGIYQEFNRTNSVQLLPPERVSNTDSMQPEALDEGAEENVYEEMPLDADTEDVTPLEFDAIEEDDVVESNEGAQVDSVDNADPVQLEEDEAVESVETSGETSEVPAGSYISARDAIFGFFARVTDTFLFAQESVVEEISEVPADAEVTEVVVNDAMALPSVTHEHDEYGEHTHDEALPTEVHTGVRTEDALLSDDRVVDTYRIEELIASTTVDEREEVAHEDAIQTEERSDAYPIEFTDFSIPPLSSGQFIMNVQLRMSLGAQYEMESNVELPLLAVEYTFGDTWTNAGEIILTDEVSNALNGGYFLFALPQITDPSVFDDLRVRVSYVGDRVNLEHVYVDSLWLEFDTETIDRDVLSARLVPERLSYSKLPDMHELISSELDFGRTEQPKFVLRYEPQRNVVVQFFRNIFSKHLAEIREIAFVREDAGAVLVSPEITMTDDGLWTIQMDEEDTEKLQPGTYTVELVVAEGGKTYTDTFNFQWGMLAVNPDQTEYSVGDAVTVSLAALSPDGNTICDAALSLYVIDPNEYISEAQVYNSGLCNGNNVIDAPDYISQFIVETPGTYEMYVEHIGEDGEVRSHTSDTFIVSEAQDVWIERVGPTRIYPPALYPMQITVHTEVPLTGVLTERVPNTFVVRDTDAQIQEIDGMFELSWDLAMTASSSKEFSYSFDAPDISPYLYTLGPAQIVSDEANIVVDEILPTANEMLLTETIITDLEGEVVVPIVVSEEVAPDAVPTESAVVHEVDIVSEESTLEEETAPLLGTVEVPVEEVVEEPSLIEAIVDFVFGDDTSPTENEEVIETVAPGDSDSISPGEGIVPEEVPVTDEVTVPVEMNASTTTPVVTDSKGFKEHRKWQIASDATGSMLLYWASTTIPTGWTCVSCGPSDAFYQRFVLGSSTPGVNGGASTHTHTGTGAVTASAASTNINSGGGGATNVPTVAHAHTYTPTISTDNNLPAYRELVLIQHNSAGSPSSIPANAIAIFDASVPSGWIQYAPQDGVYVRNTGTTTIGTTGGTNTHSHTISGNVLATGNFTTAAAGDNLVNTASAAHTHSVSSFTDTVNHEPPYREAILGKIVATTTTPTDAMIAMWTDTPPTGWGTVSSSSEAFSSRMVKPSATYGAIGGAPTTTHANTTGITSGAPSGTQTRDLVTIDNTVTTNVHTHTVSVTNYTAVATMPPYRTAIFAKRAPGGASPNAPTIHALFDNENTGTSSPRFEFTGDDPDGADTLVYQFEWDDDKDVGSSPLGSRTSDDESGCSPDCFTNTASSSDTHPFTDNERIRFIPPSALTSGVTYYFRVRVKETVGDTWSDWSSVYSSTIESGVTLSEWLQTQGSQFEGGALTNAATTTSGAQVSSTTLTLVPTVESDWRSNTATGSATLVLTKPTGVEVGDLLLILVGNDANNATVQWDDISLRPSGFTNINEAGNATPDTHVGAFYRIADGTEGATSSVPAATSANFWGFYIRVTGASTTNPINAVGSDYAVNNLTNHPIPSVNTTLPNTLAFYMLAGDAVGTAPFSVAGAGWSESDEKTVNTAGTWGTRSMTSAGATGAATVTMNASDGASGFQFAINPASPFATVQSPEIDFDTVSGQTRWGEIEWSATEPSQTSAILRVYYTSTSTCDSLVPDSVLSGNSAGFDAASSPILIANLSTTTYNRICLKETLSIDTGVSSPTLNEWTVRWVRTPQFTQSDYLWYTNTNSSTPSDIWPQGATDLEENEQIDSTMAVLTSDILRLRMSVTATSSVVSTSSTAFKLQYADGDACSADLSWYDVGAISSTTAHWRGYNNAAASDGDTLSSALLQNTTVFESYEEENDSTLNPRGIPIGGVAEWDFALQNYAGTPGALYCFRMVTAEGALLNTYTNYPAVQTNASPNTIRLFSPFDNEKISSTTPFFEFDGIDTESNDITFQIQIDDDYTFGSVNIDRDTVSNPTLFQNLVTPADKDPYTNGETIRFIPSSALTNGVTYYWRVRGKDPLGSNNWGEWSTIASLTVDTSVTVSTWYQTTEEQFDTNTLVGTDAIATDLIQLASGSTTGTTTSAAIDFLDGTLGNAWGSLSWTDNETSGDIKYRIQYYDSANDIWDFIPEADLTGNTAGFDTSPVSLLDLNVETYEVIRLVALFTNSGGSPTLSEWTIAWGYRIEVPTINAPFRNEKVSTTTPTFEFYTTDPQNDSLVYEIQWSASSTFAASTTRMSSSSVGFVNMSNGGDTSPFISGETIQFTIQSGDALTNGQTYWWRVRATDPQGSQQYSFYSDEQSFTVDTSVTVSTWFQTTAEQFNTDTLSGTVVTGTSSVTIATTSVESLIGYAEGSLTVPKYRLWDGAVWGSEQSALDVGAAIGWVVTKAAPDTNEYIMASQGTDADVNVQVYANGNWDNLQEITTTIPNTNMRGFDIAYEQVSGDAIAVTCDGDAIASYWVWNGATWTNGGSVGSILNNTCGWVKLISDPTSDEIIAVLRGTTGTRYEARVWDGSAWGNSATLGSMNQTTHEGIAASYEDSGNQAVVVASNGTAASYNWRAWNGATWTATATVALGDDFEAGTLSSDDGTDNMAFCYVDEDGDIGVQRWTGAGFVAGVVEFSTAWATAGNIYNDRPVDCAFETRSGRDGYITGVFSTTTAMASTTWTGAAWSTNRKISTFGPSGVRVQLSRTGDGLIQAVSYASTTDRYEYAYWDGSAWSALQVLETDGAAGATPYKEPFMIAPKNPVTTGTMVGDPVGIDFYAGSGPYWQQMSWTDTESGGSSILYQVEYYDGDSWELIPNAYIPGNSTGTSTSPINLANVLPVATFNLIRPVATFTCNLGTCPVLADWTITWSAGITISGSAQQFDESSNVTAGTVAVALNGVLQTGKTGTISGGSWSIANVNASPGDIVTVFVSGANETNEAVALARYDGVGDMSGMRLYEQHVTLGSDDATTTPFTNASFAFYDYTNDEDIFFNATGTALSLCVDDGCANAELYVMASSTLTVSDTFTFPSLHNSGTVNLGGNTLYVSRSWDNNATITAATSSVVFTATSTTETIDETGAVSPAFYNLTFGTTTGAATWNLVSPLDVNGALTVTRGTLSRGTTSISVAGALTNGANGTWVGMGTTTFDGTGTSNWTDSNGTLQNIGRVLIDGTSKTVQLASAVTAQSIYIGADDIFDVSTLHHGITVLSDWINTNTFVARNGTVTFGATTTNRTITAGGDAFYNLSFTGAGGSWSFTEADLSVGNNLTIATGTVTLSTGTTTITGSFSSAGGTFAHNNATVLMNASSAKTITASGTPFTNAFYNLRFTGSGSWSFVDTSATTTNDFTITQGSVTLPGTMLTVGGNFVNSAGTFTHNSGTVKLSAASARVIDTNSSFNNLSFTGSGSWSFVDANVTALGSVTVSNGTVTLPSGTLTLGGSLTNTATTTHNSGTVLFNSTDVGETISLGSSTLSHMTFNSGTGGWTIISNATTTGSTTLTAVGSFTLNPSQVLSVGGVFTNSVGGASTTWTGSTLSIESGSSTINTKTNTGDVYGTLRVKANTDVRMWNSSSTVYEVDATGSLYSQDHSGVDGDLYIFGGYERTTGTEYWSYTTDFDGTALSTTSRQVDVRFASGATAQFTNSVLSITGTTTGSTTIANQGSGTYTVGVTNGTTTASYYDFRDLGSTGLSLGGTTKVTSLSDGSFTPSTVSGSGLTVSSTTIGTNSGLQIYRVAFSTTTAIAAYNVAQTDAVPTSYWWFRDTTGNIDGEAFDNDTGDPGSIRWDDSLLTIVVSGTVYADDETTPLGAPVCGVGGTPVRIVVEGGASYDGACDGSGAYTIPGVVIVGDPTLTVYLNGAGGGARAVTVTKTPTTDITDLDLIENRVIVRHENTAAMTIGDMASFDSTDDVDIAFAAATGTVHTLVVASDTELYVWATSTFTPGGAVTLLGGGTGNDYDGSLHLDNASVFTGAGTTTYAIGGSYTQEAGATFVPASSTITFTATTTGKGIVSATGESITVHALTFTGVGGGWNLTGDITASGNISLATGTLTGTGDITLSNGSLYGDGLLSLGVGTTTIARENTLGGTQAWTFGNLVLGNGLVTGTTTFASVATTTVLGKLTIDTAHYLKAGGSVLEFRGAGTVFVETGTYIEGTSTVRYSGTSGSAVLSTNYYNLAVGALGGTPTYTAVGLGITVQSALTVGGVSATIFTLDTNDPALDVDGTVTITANGTLVGSASGMFTVGGSWDNDGTFTGSNGSVTFDGAGAVTLAAGNSPWSNVIVSGVGTYTVSEAATTTTAFILTNATGFTVGSGVSLAVGGTFTNGVGGAATTWTGSTLHLYGGGNYTVNASTTSDTYNRLTISGTTQVRLWNSSAATPDLVATASLYSQDHAAVNGALYVYGAYTKTSGTDYWNYATDFDGTALGGGARKVDVYFASSSSATYTGGGLHVLGVSTASTTLQNQGVGTYALTIGGTASTSMSYYEVRHVNASGLTFSGTPQVTTLSYGDYIVSVNGGSAITVGGTVIDQNPAKTFTNNSFATSSLVSAFNVTATGTSVSSWRFTNHTGTIDGEAYDVDPDGDPGYVVWDDSAASISFTGRVYSDEGSTVSTICDSSTQNIVLRIAGLTTYTTFCNGDGFGGGTGSYTFTGVSYSPGDSLVVFIDGEAEKAAVVTEDPVSNINNLDLYENRVIVRHESTDPLSIADMALWDSSDDADIPFTAVDAGSDTLTIPANTKFIVWTAKEFEPMGDVTISGGGGGAAYDGTLELYTNAIFDATGSESHSIGGSLISGFGAVIDDETSTFIFTTTGSTRTIDTNEYSFHNLTLSGSGSWTVTNSALEVGNDLTITQGTLTLPSGTTTIAGSFLNTGGSFVQNGGRMYFTSTGAESIRIGSSSFGTTTFNGVGGSWTYLGTHATTTGDFIIVAGTVTSATGTLTIGGDFVNQGTFTHNSGTLRFTSSKASTTVTTSGSDLGSTTFSGSGSFIFTTTNVALQGTLTILQGTVRLATGTHSIGGSLRNSGGSFVHSTGTVLFNSSDTGEVIDAGGSLFTNVTIAAPTGGYTITSNATTTEDFALTSGAAFTLNTGITLGVGGVFTNLVGGGATTWTGSTLRLYSGLEYTMNTSSVGGDAYSTLILDADTDIRTWNSSATVVLGDTQSSLYSQDNAAVNGELYIYGNYVRTTGTDYWSYATDFDGTSLTGIERAVTVRHASGATSTFSGGTLSIVGSSVGTTTITNQGSGTYSWNVTGGTLQAQQYAVRNTNASGLVLSGETTVTSLSNGDFELGVNGGTLMTISSTTINYNASMVITGMRFATTTAITGENGAVVGTTLSAWTFTTHRGNLASESFDDDGVDDCGSLRWSDSSCLITQQSAYRWRNDDGGEGVPSSEWYDTDWTKRTRVSVENNDATVYTNAVVEVTLPYDSDMQSDFDDIRFTGDDGVTPLDFVREVYTASTEATFWVEVPSLAASAVTPVYAYYGNGSIAYGGVGTSTFSVYDDFEDDTITEYSGDISLFNSDTSFAYQGTYGLEATDPNDRTTDGIFRTDIVVSQGETIRYFQYIDTSAGSGDETCTLFGVQTPGTNNDNYAVCLEQFGVDRVSLVKDAYDNDTNATMLASTTITYATGWYEVEIDWDTDDSIFVSVYSDDVLVATTTATDSSYTTGGIGFAFWFQHGGWDLYSARTLMTIDPTVTLGFEQVSGGASWIAALNTSAQGVSVNTTIRPRFLIENTGLVVTDAYRLEYAAKGASPSCEAVSPASYTAVPDQASCAGEPICMESSIQFTNNASTTDILGGEGTFTYGQIIEDPDNTTESLTVDANRYTEVEYAITLTDDASDSSYCLRVSDAGTNLDSYVRVAELGLIFIPNITSLVFNNGLDISLISGTTTRIYATGTVTDLNGYTDIETATTTFYQNGLAGGVGYSCTPDNNNCYRMTGSQCSFTNCSGNSCDVVCYADMYYHTNPTDTGSTYAADAWTAFLDVSDQSGEIATTTSVSVDLLTLRAIAVDSTIDYGALEVNSDTGSYNATTTVQNIGNDALDISVEGTDLTDGGSSQIPVTEQIFATSTFTYTACTVCSALSTSATSYELDLAKPASTTPSIADQLFWGIAVPFGVAGTAHSGTNTFYAIGD